ncbi:MAG: M23 family metallopeptidase [Alphaproteobacteria bacterium]
MSDDDEKKKKSAEDSLAEELYNMLEVYDYDTDFSASQDWMLRYAKGSNTMNRNKTLEEQIMGSEPVGDVPEGWFTLNPINSSTAGITSGHLDYRRSSFSGGNNKAYHHKGIDISARNPEMPGRALWLELNAAAPGKIVINDKINYSNGKGYGYQVVIEHDNGFKSFYNHMSNKYVDEDGIVQNTMFEDAAGKTCLYLTDPKGNLIPDDKGGYKYLETGQEVAIGDQIGNVGNTGFCVKGGRQVNESSVFGRPFEEVKDFIGAAAHLDYEITDASGVKIDPRIWIDLDKTADNENNNINGYGYSKEDPVMVQTKTPVEENKEADPSLFAQASQLLDNFLS